VLFDNITAQTVVELLAQSAGPGPAFRRMFILARLLFPSPSGRWNYPTYNSQIICPHTSIRKNSREHIAGGVVKWPYMLPELQVERISPAGKTCQGRIKSRLTGRQTKRILRTGCDKLPYSFLYDHSVPFINFYMLESINFVLHNLTKKLEKLK
jgi:hypothetical protein